MMNLKSVKDCYTLANGVEIPCVGFGTFQISDEQMCMDIVKSAIDAGYTHIDTASFYKNEKSVGAAIKESGIEREDIFVTSKLWNNDQGYESTLKAFEKTIDNLGLEYLDLYLIHWPIPFQFKDAWQEKNLETWRAFEELYKKGRIKAIGVSNFLEHHLTPLIEKSEIMPMVNQLEIHPAYPQNDIVNFCQCNNIIVESWGPLMQGKAFDNQTIIEIGNKYGKSPAQVCIRWAVQKGIVPLPKSQTPERIFKNTLCFDFQLDEQDMEKLDELQTLGSVSVHPDSIQF